MSKDREIQISMGTSKNFLEDILTRDISTLDALFDLIDNSIDAARDSLFEQGAVKRDKYDLPQSYHGFKVDIELSERSIKVEDNCFGMKEKTLKSEAFVIAKSSEHEYGIGQYGIGLKRSLLKIGESYDVSIDNGEQKYDFNFTNKQIGGSDGKVTAVAKDSEGRPFTTFVVSDLKAEIKGDIQNERWLKRAKDGLKDRYSIYFSKGFEISIKYFDNPIESLNSKLPSLRTDGKFLPTFLPVKNSNNVSITIESGIHQDYMFPGEQGYSLSINRTLTDDFGIYFICNDRVIVKASTQRAHGWLAKWHSEYNGFVCLVRFVAKNPNSLPWNTAKSAMREDAGLFLDVVDNLHPILETYRSEIKKRYSSKKKTNEDAKGKPKVKKKTKKKTKVKGKARGDDATPRPTEQLHRDRILFVDWNKAKTRVPESHQKSYDTYFELCQLNSQKTPIACLATFRVFIERTFKDTGEALGVEFKNPSLRGKAKTLVNKLYKDKLIDKRLFGIVINYTEDGLLSFNTIQDLMHSKEMYPTHSRMNNFWDELDPFIAICWQVVMDAEQ